MCRQRKTFTALAVVPTLLIPLVVAGCGSSGRSTTVVQAWDDRPRVFTAEPGEEHSRFAKVAWYDRPRFFTRAEGENQSRFTRIVDGRPRLFTSGTQYGPTYTTSYPSTTYGTTTYGSTQTYGATQYDNTYYQPTTDVRPDPRFMPGYTGYTSAPGHSTDSARVNRDRATGTESRDYTTGSVNSYGAETHRNVTQPPRSNTTSTTSQSRVALTSDPGTRSFDGLIANWPQEARTAAMAMQAKYGPPDSTTSDQLTWRDQDPFAEIVVMKNGTPHAFPTQHTDVLAQSIYLNVEANQADELTSFRGNIKVDHARGLLTAKCKDEASNFLALNLAHEILSGEKSVVEANGVLMEKSRGGIEDDDYMQELQFDVGEDISGSNRVNRPREAQVDYPDTDTDVDTPESDD